MYAAIVSPRFARHRRCRATDVLSGTPVALHGAYDVLAVGGVKYNVAR